MGELSEEKPHVPSADDDGAPDEEWDGEKDLKALAAVLLDIARRMEPNPENRRTLPHARLEKNFRQAMDTFAEFRELVKAHHPSADAEALLDDLAARANLDRDTVRGMEFFDVLTLMARNLPTWKGKRRKGDVVPVFSEGEADMMSAAPVRHVIDSLWGQWKLGEKGRPHYVAEEKKGTTKVTLLAGLADDVDAPLKDKDLSARLVDEVMQFDDTDADLFCIAIAHHITHSDAEGNARIDDAALLDARGISPRRKGGYRAGHRREDRAEVTRRMDRLLRLYLDTQQQLITETVKGRKKIRVWSKDEARGPALKLDERKQREWAQLRWDETGAAGQPHAYIRTEWTYGLGPSLRPFAKDPNRQVAPLMQQVVAYHARDETYEKRLGLYFTFHLKIAHPAPLKRSIGGLLDACRLPVDERNPQRTRDRTEKALDRLQADGVIPPWKYGRDLQLPARKWLPVWREWMVVIDQPPKNLEAPAEPALLAQASDG